MSEYMLFQSSAATDQKWYSSLRGKGDTAASGATGSFCHQTLYITVWNKKNGYDSVKEVLFWYFAS